MLRSRAALPVRGYLRKRAMTDTDALRRIGERTFHYRRQTDPADLGALVQDLCEMGQDPVFQDALDQWLCRYGAQWRTQRLAALGAVVEAGALLGLPSLDATILEILEDDAAEPRTCSVAAQRVRLVGWPEPAARRRVLQALLRRIERWEQESVGDAVTALPSVPCVGADEAVGWLCQRVLRGPAPIAHAATLGLLDWATGAARGVPVPSEVSRRQLLCAVQERLLAERARPRSSGELVPVLLWAAGALASSEDLPAVAALLAEVFCAPVGFEDVGAVKAGRRLLQQHGEAASRALAAAFVADPAAEQRFLGRARGA